LITQFHPLPWRAIFLFFIIFHISFLTVQAQEWEIGGGLGAMNYKGDLSPAIQPGFARPGGNLFVRYNAGRAVSFKFNLLGGKVFAEDRQSDDPFLLARNRSFEASIFEFSPQFEYNFLNYRDEKTRQNWTPYVLLGAALFTYSGEDNTRRDFKGTQFAIPFGLGIKYVLGGNWNLGLEFGARKTFTDTLDGLGGPLVNNRLLNGNPDSKDMYIYTGLTISYTFYRVLCPEFY
jgi:hypothetical protein